MKNKIRKSGSIRHWTILLTVTLLALRLCMPELYAQNARKAPNLPYYDYKRLHFGFALGINNANFATKANTNLNPFDSIRVIETTPSLGFDVGLVADLRLGEYLNLRFIPEISLIDRTVNYRVQYLLSDETVTNKKLESVCVDLPLLLKLKSSRMHNCRVYVVNGCQLSLDMASQAKKKNTNQELVFLKLNSTDLQVQTGVGMDFYANFFKFSIEAKMSYGFANLLKNEDNVYTNSIDYLRGKIFHISILFE